MRDKLLILKAKPVQRVEIARSFSYKLNCGNYESRDFFCSQKAECAIEDAEEVSIALYRFCKLEVLRAVSEFKLEAQQEQAIREAQNEIRQQARRKSA